MIAWEVALQKFIDEWKPYDFVLACLLTGSYAVGNHSEKSDIDVIIILSNDTEWRERGNKIIDGYLVEYFANPVKQIIAYMNESLRQGTREDACMLLNGKVLFDKTGITEELKLRAKNDMQTSLKEIDLSELELAKYHVWDYFEEVNEAYINHSESYFSLHYLFLDMIITLYSKYSKNLLPSKYKIYRFLKDENYAQKYGIKEYSDRDFVELYLNCYQKDLSQAYNSLNNLLTYLFDKMGGFNIDGFRARGNLSI